MQAVTLWYRVLAKISPCSITRSRRRHRGSARYTARLNRMLSLITPGSITAAPTYVMYATGNAPRYDLSLAISPIPFCALLLRCQRGQEGEIFLFLLFYAWFLYRVFQWNS